MVDIKSKIRTIPDFPKKGVMFRDITTLLQDPEGFKHTVDQFVERYKDMDIDLVVGIESRGFILGGAIAHRLGAGFVLARKPGKLPADTHSIEYDLEYGKDALEIHKDSMQKGDKILLVDDLLATGGTCKAAIDLVEYLGGEVVECVFVIVLPELGGLKKLEGYPVHYLVEFNEEELP